MAEFLTEHELKKDKRTVITSQNFVPSDQVEWEDLGGGLSRQILGFDSQLMLVRVRFQKGSVGVKHAHSHRQVSYIESGAFEVEIDGEKRVLKPGDGFYVPPNVVHGAVALEESTIIDVFSPAREDFLA